MESWITALTIAALLLCFVEIFFTPGYGVSGCLGFIFLGVATYLASLQFGWIAALSLFAVSFSILTLCFILFYRSPFFSWLVSNSKGKNS